jgi:hypothetical protein
MATEHDIPAHVLRFLTENIDTVPQLETLLIMAESQRRSWAVAEVATHNYISNRHAEQTLKALQRRGLVSAEESPRRYRFNPQSAAIRDVVADLARCYPANLSRIATLIHSKPSASVTEFARAFELKKDR